MKKLLALTFVLMSFIGYGYAGVFSTDSVLLPKIRNIQLKSFSAEENRAVFDVTVYNPNDFKLPVRELSGDIYLNDQIVANLEATSKQSLGALATQLFTVPVVINPDALIISANGIMTSGVAKYNFKGYMLTPVGELPISQQDQLTTEQMLALLHISILTKQKCNDCK